MTEEEYRKEKAKFYHLIHTKDKKLKDLAVLIKALEKAEEDLSKNNWQVSIALKHTDVLKVYLERILGKNKVTGNMIVTLLMSKGKLKNCISACKKLQKNIEKITPQVEKILKWANKILFVQQTWESFKNNPPVQSNQDAREMVDSINEGRQAMTEFIKGVKSISPLSDFSTTGKIFKAYLDFFISMEGVFEKTHTYSLNILRETEKLENKGNIIINKLHRNRILLKTDLIRSKKPIP